MRARTSGVGRNGCTAVQHSDQMTCRRCGFTYDVNDPDPPECLSDKQIGQRHLAELKRALDCDRSRS